MYSTELNYLFRVVQRIKANDMAPWWISYGANFSYVTIWIEL